jgi:hypothetical protein
MAHFIDRFDHGQYPELELPGLTRVHVHDVVMGQDITKYQIQQTNTLYTTVS